MVRVCKSFSILESNSDNFSQSLAHKDPLILNTIYLNSSQHVLFVNTGRHEPLFVGIMILYFSVVSYILVLVFFHSSEIIFRDLVTFDNYTITNYEKIT